MPRVYEHAAIEIAIELTTLDCAHCGIVFGISTQLEKRRRKDGEAFYCPNGHSNVFTPSELEKAKKEVERLKSSVTFFQGRLRDESNAHDGTRRSLAATKGQLTKVKNRVHAGVCPYCHRHFTALERHMASKHPHEQETD
jgi:Zn finger protein HypA/HybF involved in hydrogenase expression